MITIVSIDKFVKSNQQETALSQIESIFFSSSARQEFANDLERSQFRYKYLDWYRIHHPELLYLAVTADAEINGYICGTPNTRQSPELFELHPWLEELTAQCESFPAHLHINLTEATRGMGVGSQLIEVFENRLKSLKVAGVHLVTSPSARNVGFYKKNGYNFESVFHWKNVDLLFLGKQL